jgi:hypothetical protein
MQQCSIIGSICLKPKLKNCFAKHHAKRGAALHSERLLVACSKWRATMDEIPLLIFRRKNSGMIVIVHFILNLPLGHLPNRIDDPELSTLTHSDSSKNSIAI